MKNYLQIILVFQLFLSAAFTHATETVVVGTVRALVDKTPLEAVNIYFPGTSKGVQSDKDGFFVIKSTDDENSLIFSCIGFKSKTVKIKPGETSGVHVELIEDINLLADLFVIPGTNPALELMKKVRDNIAAGQLYESRILSVQTEQEMLMLKKDSLSSSSGIFELLKEGTVSSGDKDVFLPIYYSENQFSVQSGEKNLIKTESRANPENIKLLMEKITGEINNELNFYKEDIVIFGKTFISPVSSSANNFYRYYLIDSSGINESKRYRIKFKSKNPGSLAFNGEMIIDSVTSGIREIKAELPRFVNLNFVKDIQIKVNYHQFAHKIYLPEKEEMILRLQQDIFPENPEFHNGLFFFRSVQHSVNTSLTEPLNSFAGSDYSKELITKSILSLAENRIFKTAKWLADIAITGYAQLGVIDIGKVNQLARLTDTEGFRFSIPLRTNENLMKDLSISGSWGYGFKNHFHAYSGELLYKLPFNRKTLIGAGLKYDLCRIDYDINNFKLKEDPLLSPDDDITSTFLSFKSADKISPRKYLYLSLMHDWTNNFEMSLFYRKTSTFSDLVLPLISQNGDFNYINHQSVTLHTRLSFDEKSFEDHLQRLYVYNDKPVISLDIEAGQTLLNANKYDFIKLKSEIRQKVDFLSGQWSYSVEAGAIIGSVPYYLLHIPVGIQSTVFRRNAYAMMNIMEYGADKYIAIHQELLLNGLIFNKIPLLRNLKLREIVTLKCLVGSLDERHQQLLYLPSYMKELNSPYIEAGVGVTNILRVFTMQVYRRFTDTDMPGVRKWSLLTGIRFNF